MSVEMRNSNSRTALLSLSALMLALLFQKMSVSQTPSGPADLLRLRPLMQSLQRQQPSGAQASPWVEPFLHPVQDEVDAILEVEPQVREEALQWLDRYAESQQLFRTNDLQELRKQLSQLPVASVNRWLSGSAELRERLLSPEWRETDVWLGRFLAAQAIYSAEELSRWRSLLAACDVNQMHHVLDHFQNVRNERRRQQSTSAQHRQLSLSAAREWRVVPRVSQAGALPGSPAMTGPVVSTPARRMPLLYRRSLSQRAGDIYIYRVIYGDNLLWWGTW